MPLPTTIFYWGNAGEYVTARQLAAREAIESRKGITRDASVFDGNVERCDRAVVLPGVHPGFALRITRAYQHALILVERWENVSAQPDPGADAKAAAAAAIAREQAARALVTRMRRLPTGRIRQEAIARGIDPDKDNLRDRGALISAIVAAEERTPQ